MRPDIRPGENLTRDDVIDYLGAENWEQVKQEFGSRTLFYIWSTLDEMFPNDNNVHLAHATYRELNK